ncbi:adhesion G-protein coupled receptor D1-like isoform X2 [Biomphalaria glabrata]|uniref:Adhesion G-protein coupled receptor D1-like isoform X2 n=1 Tax=Biomphalaria glabrata TaxID=6526 RepID=A0A9W3B850_BIOGL|nr:adhesion G-protein coupled receptor D1-like isoform X2 [Biomphalaria glabrata]
MFNKEVNIAYKSVIYGSSFVSLLVYLTVVHLFKNFRSANNRTYIHRQYAACLVVTQFFVITMVFVSDWATEFTYCCYFMAVLLHYSLTSMHLWMLVEALVLASSFFCTYRMQSINIVSTILCWGFPLFVVATATATYKGSYTAQSVCWIEKSVIYSSLLPTINIALLSYGIYIIKRSDDYTISMHNETTKKYLSVTTLLIPAQMLTGMVAVMAITLEDDGSVVFVYFTFAFIDGCSVIGILFLAFHFSFITEDCLTIFRGLNLRIPLSLPGIMEDQIGRQGDKVPIVTANEQPLSLHQDLRSSRHFSSTDDPKSCVPNK